MEKSNDDAWKDVILLFSDVLAGVCSNCGTSDMVFAKPLS